MDIIRTKQKNWIGHILRGNSLQREIIEGRMEGKRGRGRPRQKLMNWMMEDGYKNSRKMHNIEKSGVAGHLADHLKKKITKHEFTSLQN